MKLLLAIILTLLSVNLAIAKEANPLGVNFYGSFLHTERVPNALFFFSDIKEDDSFELRKALRSHDVDTIVLSSRGGSVWEGLNMAGIIHDKRLKTYVPQQGLGADGNCASACSFMFFGGSARVADGALGVHQFYSGAAKQNAQIGETQSNAQFTVSEIIGFLNEFETPPFVFERMFQQKEMYYFSDNELAEINRNSEELSEADKTAISRFIRLFNIALEERLEKDKREVSERVSKTPKVKPKTKPKTVQPKLSSKAIIRQVQTELNRLNCGAGRPDGVIGNKTRSALRRYGTAINRELPQTLLTSKAFLSVLKRSSVPCKNNSTNVITKSKKTLITNRILEGSWGRTEHCFDPESGKGGNDYRVFEWVAVKQSGQVVTYEATSKWNKMEYRYFYAADLIEERSYYIHQGKRRYYDTVVKYSVVNGGEKYRASTKGYRNCTYFLSKKN